MRIFTRNSLSLSLLILWNFQCSNSVNRRVKRKKEDENVKNRCWTHLKWFNGERRKREFLFSTRRGIFPSHTRKWEKNVSFAIFHLLTVDFMQMLKENMTHWIFSSSFSLFPFLSRFESIKMIFTPLSLFTLPKMKQWNFFTFFTTSTLDTWIMSYSCENVKNSQPQKQCRSCKNSHNLHREISDNKKKVNRNIITKWEILIPFFFTAKDSFLFFNAKKKRFYWNCKSCKSWKRERDRKWVNEIERGDCHWKYDKRKALSNSRWFNRLNLFLEILKNCLSKYEKRKK